MENNLKIIVLVVAGIALPLLLIPIIKITGFSEVVEEIAKATITLFLILKLPGRKTKIFAGIGFGFLFGLSENIFYLNNIFRFGDFGVFGQRFLWTVPMHVITVLVMVLTGLQKKRFLIFGLAGAIILHLLFNNAVAEFLMR